MDLWESESPFPNPNRNGAGEKHPHKGSYAEITKQQMGSSCSIEQLSILGRRGDFPSIKMPIEAHKRGLDHNKFNLVGRLDLVKIEISEVRLIAFALWKPKGVCRIVPVGKGYFTIFLDNEEDRNNIWRGGPWMIDKQNNYLDYHLGALVLIRRHRRTPMLVTGLNFLEKRNKEPLGNGIGTSATTESGGKEVGDDQITTDELCHALISVADGQHYGTASACKEGVASKTSGNRPTGAKEGADSISQIIRETSLILLHKDENWADMVEDEERDEACVAKSASNSNNNAKKSNKKARAKGIVRRGLWKDLIDVSKLNLPWLALGDFNIIRLQSERFGGTGPTLSAIKEFNDCLDECELIESPSVGMKLTWCNGQSGGARISKRLDRALYNGMWAGKYDGWKVKALARENSDHSALVGEPNPIPKPKNILFRFLKCWIELPGFQDLIKTSWEAAQAGNPIIKLMKKLQRLKLKLSNREKQQQGVLQRIFPDVQKLLKTCTLFLNSLMMSL
ncbi:hypothetical protein GIB67_026690 [Kingdonia uniflora]|uniref:DUF4283 domain-containing protein n=1 Tax=Kingdonia uniflora TaxID=39325 RepID=A0A7J7MGM4_9MAGN|nr:hypothetical protein GIB67_026690 [Kingdonia uniflora]